MILLCVGLTVAGPAAIDRGPLFVVVPWLKVGFSALQAIYIFSLGFFLVFTFRAAAVFNGFTLEICIQLRNKARTKGVRNSGRTNGSDDGRV
jgi:hypothetical protein